MNTAYSARLKRARNDVAAMAHGGVRDEDEDEEEAAAEPDGEEEERMVVTKRFRTQLDGDLVVRRIEENIRAISKHRDGMVPTPEQVEFQGYLLASLLPKIYEREWDRNRDTINRRHGFAANTPFCGFEAARGNGKTVAGAMMLAAVLHAMADRRLLCAIFAMVYEQTSMVLNAVHFFVTLLPGGASMCTRGGDELRVYPRGVSRHSVTFSRVVAKSGNTEAARGTQPHITLVDEAAFVKPNAYKRAILPMTFADNRVLWMFTSPSTADTVFQRMTSAVTRSGNPVCTLTRSRAVCPKCVGKMQCIHTVVPPLPHKSDPFKTEAYALIYQRDTETYAREIQGMRDLSDNSVYDRAAVDAMFAKPVQLVRPLPYVFVFIDPSSGGKGSQTAWILGVFQGTQFVVGAQCSFTPTPHTQCRCPPARPTTTTGEAARGASRRWPAAAPCARSLLRVARPTGPQSRTRRDTPAVRAPAARRASDTAVGGPVRGARTRCASPR